MMKYLKKGVLFGILSIYALLLMVIGINLGDTPFNPKIWGHASAVLLGVSLYYLEKEK